jgi:hypothetical protein
MKKFKWTEEQIMAIVGSIVKWRKILNEDAVDKGTKNCALCKLYNSCFPGGCTNCPVKLYVDDLNCGSTPYDEWVDHHDTDDGAHEIFNIACPECRDLAQAELDFLNEVLEAGL